MEDIHFTSKDFRVNWFSGTGSGGQHRNKHPNCCKITHIETGISAQGTESKSREINKKKAFERLTKKLLAELLPPTEKTINNITIRNYNKNRDEVHDYESGLKQSYKKVVEKNNISDMIRNRNDAMIKKENI